MKAAEAEPIYRLISNLLDPEQAPAAELAALYQDLWEIETALDELKTHLRGARIMLRSKTPELVRQELYGLLMAHFALRALMLEAALSADIDPDRLSLLHAVRRKLPAFNAIPPAQRKAFHEAVIKELLSERVAERCGRAPMRGVKRKMSRWPLRRARAESDKSVSADRVISLVQ